MQAETPYSASACDLSCDLLVVGGGVVGLWTARLAARRGMDVILADRGQIGGGASGGVLGALMPHMPERWNPKKQFQFEALRSLPDMIAALEAETGIATGYRRIGRLMPLSLPHHRALALERAGHVEEVWRPHGADLRWSVVERPARAGWPAAEAMAHGAVLETLTARLSPRYLISALKAALDADQRVTTLEGDGVDRIVDETAVLASGRTVRAGRMVIAAGHESFAMIGRLIGETLPLGSAVKGQAALLRADVPDDLPLVFQDGLYVVPHGGGLVAIGSTSEDEFDDPYGTDGRLDAVIGRARVLCPLIADATVSARWAGLRPKAAGRDPMIGRLPDVPRVVAATGGFKITLGIAHRMAEIAVGLVLGEEDGGLPDSFSVEAHRGKALEKARRQRG